MTSLISAKNLVRHYRQGGETIRALDGVSVDIDKGEMVAIMGPSGSGKSTFMNMCGALDKPTSGDLVLADRALSTLNSDELADLRNEVIGFVFQQFNLLPRTSALDNVKLPLLYARQAVENANERCMAALEAVDLASRASHHPNELSGGQQQRVAIARALVNEPQIILADEPTGALDTKTSNEVLELFQKLNDDGMTIIMVTHDEEVAEFSKRCIHFRDGHIVDDAKTATKGAAA